MSIRPVVGITTYETDASWGTWHRQATLLPTSYVRSVVRAGATSLLVPVGADAESVIGRLDGLILSGGPDVDPALYEQPAGVHTVVATGARDPSETALIAAAIEAELPLLAICRGMQLLNVIRGGSLHQHLPDIVGSDRHDPGPGEFSTHVVQVVEPSLLARALGGAAPSVPCHHHQGVDRIGAGLRPVAFDADGTIEALEDDRGIPILAVQWHPEEEASSTLFDWLAAEAAARRP